MQSRIHVEIESAIRIHVFPNKRGQRSVVGGCQLPLPIQDMKALAFALSFVTQIAELHRLSRKLSAKAAGDAILWFAYPKGTSKKYSCDFNRDDGWEVLRQAGFDSVRQVAIDDDWSALRFRRFEFIKQSKQ